MDWPNDKFKFTFEFTIFWGNFSGIAGWEWPREEIEGIVNNVKSLTINVSNKPENTTTFGAYYPAAKLGAIPILPSIGDLEEEFWNQLDLENEVSNLEATANLFMSVINESYYEGETNAHLLNKDDFDEFATMVYFTSKK